MKTSREPQGPRARITETATERRSFPRPIPHAFTLVELLVVIAIIGILAALILPALTRARAASYAVVCRNNLHQFSIAMHGYVEDYKVYPLFNIYNTDSYGQVLSMTFWFNELEPYIKVKAPLYRGWWMSNDWSSSVYDCPAYKHIPGHGPSISFAYNVSGVAEFGFVGKVYGLGGERIVPNNVQLRGPEAWRPNRESEIKKPDNMIALGDGPLSKVPTIAVPAGYPTVYVDGMLNGLLNPAWTSRNWETFFVADKLRHSGRFNIAFCDGHIEYLKYQAFYTPTPYYFRRWNSDNQEHLEALPRQLSY